MNILLKIFIGFWVIWIFWYLTGGPYRDDKTHPFVGPNENGVLQHYGEKDIKK